MKVIIFGGFGYLGLSLSKFFLKKKYKVHKFTNKNYSKKLNNSIYYNKKNFKEKILKIDPDLIFFFSGNSNPNTSKNHSYDMKRSNLPLQNFLEALKEISFKGKVFYSSSIAVYGGCASKFKVNENESLPKNYYGLSKQLAEKQIEFYSKNFDINILIMRISTFFGPSLKKQFIYEFVLKALKEKKIILKGHISDKREYIYINDLIGVINKLIRRNFNFDIVNIGSKKKIRIKHLAEEILKILHIKKKFIFTGKFKSPDFPTMSKKKLHRLIGKNFETDFKKNLANTVIHIKKSYAKN